MRSAAAVLFATVSFTTISAAADSAVAAPGDCAQPLGEFVTPPVYSQSAGVAGSASDHFVPTGDVLRVQPLELTRATLATTVNGTTDTAVSLVGETAETAGSVVRGITEPVLAVVPTEPIVAPLEPVVAPLEPVLQLVEPATTPVTNTLDALGVRH